MSLVLRTSTKYPYFMAWFIGKIFLAATVISFASWLADKKPALAGFIIALPISTLLVLLFNHAQFHDPQKSVQFARSIFISVPLSLSFFVPFLLSEKLKTNFWVLYGAGIGCLVLAFFLHKWISAKFL